MRCRAFSPFVFIDYFTNLVYILHHSVKEGGVGEIHYQLLIYMLQYGGLPTYPPLFCYKDKNNLKRLVQYLVLYLFEKVAHIRIVWLLSIEIQ